MHIGNHELNEEEAKWCQGLALELANYGTKKAISSLNIKVGQSEVKTLIAWLWSQKEPEKVEEKVEEKVVEKAEEEFFIEPKTEEAE